MRDYKIVQVPEHELEDLVRIAPSKIEQGLRFVDHQVPTDTGRVDVLLVDANDTLVIAELKVIEDDGMLVQGLDYYDYVKRNLAAFALAYKQHAINPSLEPRLFLVAPSFSAALLNRIKYISVPIYLYTFQCLELTDAVGQRIPVYAHVAQPSAPPAPPDVPTLEDHYAYIVDEAIRELARRFVADVQALDPSGLNVEPTQSYISIKAANRLVAAVYAKRRGFYVGVYDANDEWVWHSVGSESDLPDMRKMAKAKLDRLKGRTE